MITLESTASAQLSAREGGVLVIPVGATEQHGPHLPLTTDTDIAVALASRLAARLPCCIVAPPVAYGASGEHMDFPGTLSIGVEATEELLVELGRSAAVTWSRVLLLSTHGGNVSAVRSATARLRAEGHEIRAWSPPWRGDAHAGYVETSVMLAIRPEHVRYEAAAAGACEPIEHLLPRLREVGVASVSPNGVLGDPMHAEASAGRRLITEAVSDLVAFVQGWPRPSS